MAPDRRPSFREMVLDFIGHVGTLQTLWPFAAAMATAFTVLTNMPTGWPAPAYWFGGGAILVITWCLALAIKIGSGYAWTRLRPPTLIATPYGGEDFVLAIVLHGAKPTHLIGTAVLKGSPRVPIKRVRPFQLFIPEWWADAAGSTTIPIVVANVTKFGNGQLVEVRSVAGATIEKWSLQDVYDKQVRVEITFMTQPQLKRPFCKDYEFVVDRNGMFKVLELNQEQLPKQSVNPATSTHDR